MTTLLLLLTILLVTLAVSVAAAAEAAQDLLQKARWYRQYGSYPEGSVWATLAVLFWASLSLWSMTLIGKFAFVAAMC